MMFNEIICMREMVRTEKQFKESEREEAQMVVFVD